MVYIIVQISPKIGFNLGTVPYKAIENQFNYYYNLWKNDQITFETPDDEDKFLSAVCISRLRANDAKFQDDVKMHGDVILERELKKLNDFKINYDI